MDRIIKFVEMAVRDVHASDQFKYFEKDTCPVVHCATSPALFVDIGYSAYVVPVNHIRYSDRDDLFIAYSKDVEELLDIPISLIVERSNRENDLMTEARVELSGIKSELKILKGRIGDAGLLTRLKYSLKPSSFNIKHKTT